MRPRGGQEDDKAQPQRTATKPSHRVDRVQGRGQEEDKRRTRPSDSHRVDRVQGRGQEEDKRRTRPRHSHRLDRVQGRGQEEDKRRTRPSHRAQPQRSKARPVSMASSFLSKIEPQQSTVWGKKVMVLVLGVPGECLLQCQATPNSSSHLDGTSQCPRVDKRDARGSTPLQFRGSDGT